MGPRVLVVDDDDDIRETLASILVEHGFDVVQAANGRLALTEIDRQLPDIVLLDLMMPVLDGWQTLELLRGTLKHADLPIIVLSASAPPNGCTDYLRKPIHLDRLLAVVDVICARSSSPASIIKNARGAS